MDMEDIILFLDRLATQSSTGGPLWKLGIYSIIHVIN